jgi:hypothetical protein
MADQGKQDIVRKLIHIFLDVPHDIFVNFTRSIERGTRHRNAHSVSKNPTPNPRALFPFGPESPSPGAIADGHLPQFGPSTSAHPPAPSLTSSHALSSLSRENDPDPQTATGASPFIIWVTVISFVFVVSFLYKKAQELTMASTKEIPLKDVAGHKDNVKGVPRVWHLRPI